MAPSRSGTIVAAALGIAIALAVGYALHIEAKKRAEERALIEVVGDTTAQLRDVLKTPSLAALEKIEGNLRVAKSWSNAQVADATEHYLIGAREIVRRRTESAAYAQQAAESRAALAAHMRRAAARDSAWLRTASALKQRVERDHFDLELSLRTLADLLNALPDAQKRLAPHVQGSLLLEEGVRKQAQQQIVEEARLAAGELKKARALPAR